MKPKQTPKRPAPHPDTTEALDDLGPRCAGCGQPLGLPNGYGGTGLCGPCATGESETLDEIGETW